MQRQNETKQNTASMSVNIFETALNSKEPIKELFDMAKNFIQKGELENLHDIDVMLIDRFVEYLRSGTIEDLNAFQIATLSFIDSPIGDQLKENEEGRKFFYRYEHFHDLCNLAVENYDPPIIMRFVESRRYGKELLKLLFQNKNGIRHNELSQKLGLSPQYLSKLLREFEEHHLISRERENKLSIIKLGITGKAYMKDNPPSFTIEEKTQPEFNIACPTEEYMPDSIEYYPPRRFFFGPNYAGH